MPDPTHLERTWRAAIVLAVALLAATAGCALVTPARAAGFSVAASQTLVVVLRWRNASAAGSR